MVAVAPLVVAALLVGCSSDDAPIDDAPIDDTVPGAIDAPVFDPTVEDGVDTNTNEGENLGFDADEDSGRVTPLEPVD